MASLKQKIFAAEVITLHEVITAVEVITLQSLVHCMQSLYIIFMLIMEVVNLRKNVNNWLILHSGKI